jgi:hypothetical protein
MPRRWSSITTNITRRTSRQPEQSDRAVSGPRRSHDRGLAASPRVGARGDPHGRSGPRWRPRQSSVLLGDPRVEGGRFAEGRDRRSHQEGLRLIRVISVPLYRCGSEALRVGVGGPRRKPTDGPARDHVAARPGQRAVARQGGAQHQEPEKHDQEWSPVRRCPIAVVAGCRPTARGGSAASIGTKVQYPRRIVSIRVRTMEPGRDDMRVR